MVQGGVNMVKIAKIYMNKSVLERVFRDSCTHTDVEIGGRWIGHVYSPGENPTESDVSVDDENMTYVVYDYIPTGPNPQTSTAIELQPDREYQLWALRKLQSIDENIEVLGSWHSHIPNGLDRYSRVDHHSYYSKLNNENNPYPFDGLLCSLIHQFPENEKQTDEFLDHAWFPKGGGLGQHSWYENDAINWIDLPKIGEEFIDLEDFSPYLEATGFRKISLDEWVSTITHVAESSGYEDHTIKRSPQGNKILLLEQLPNGIDFALEIQEDGSAFFIQKDDSGKQRKQVEDVQNGMALLEQSVLEITGLSAKWSHVNSTLAKSLNQNKQPHIVEEERKKGLFARIFGR